MGLGKQAKILSSAQQKAVLASLTTRRHAIRNRCVFLLSVDAGLRAKEVASIEWSMITDAEGNLTDEIRLENKAAKGASGGVVYISKRLKQALSELAESGSRQVHVVTNSRGQAMSAQVVTNWFFHLYRDLGFEGCSSHSGRRTAITRWSRKISSVGGSLRDVQALARHASLQTTERYIELSEQAGRKVVG